MMPASITAHNDPSHSFKGCTFTVQGDFFCKVDTHPPAAAPAARHSKPPTMEMYKHLEREKEGGR